MLQPLSEIAPDLVLPGQKKSVVRLLRELPAEAASTPRNKANNNAGRRILKAFAASVSHNSSPADRTCAIWNDERAIAYPAKTKP